MPPLPWTTPPAIVAQVSPAPAPSRASLLRSAARGDLEAAASLFYLDLEAKSYDEALRYGGRYLQARPKNAAFAIDYAGALLAAGKIDAARDLVIAQEPYLRAHPATAGILSDLFYAYVRTKSHDRAIAFGALYQSLHPADGGFAVDFAYELMAAGQVDAARDLAVAQADYLRAHPAAAGILSDLFYAYAKIKDHATAIAFAQRYQTIRPDDGAFAIDFAYELLADGKSDDARTVVNLDQTYIQSHPVRAGIYADLFYTYSQAKRNDVAIEFGKRYLTFHPENDAFALDLAYVYLGLNRVEDVRELISSRDAYFAQNPKTASIWEDIASRDAQVKHYRSAIADTDRYLKFVPGDTAARQQRQFYRDDIFGGPRFASFGSAQYEGRFADEFFGLDASYALAPAAAVQPYLATHAGADIRSGPPGSSQIFADNAVVVDLGLRAHFGPDFALFAEGGAGIGLRGQGSKTDLRYGMTYSEQWGNLPHAFTSASASAGVYSRYNNNLIAYYSAYHELGGKARIRPLFGVNGGADSQGLFGNTFVEAFAGTQFGTSHVFARIEDVVGWYLTRGVPIPNPSYSSLRAQVLFNLSR